MKWSLNGLPSCHTDKWPCYGLYICSRFSLHLGQEEFVLMRRREVENPLSHNEIEEKLLVIKACLFISQTLKLLLSNNICLNIIPYLSRALAKVAHTRVYFTARGPLPWCRNADRLRPGDSINWAGSPACHGWRAAPATRPRKATICQPGRM